MQAVAERGERSAETTIKSRPAVKLVVDLTVLGSLFASSDVLNIHECKTTLRSLL